MPSELTVVQREYIFASQKWMTDELETAQRQKQMALARGLAAQAELIRNQDIDSLPLSVLLAIEAMRRSPSLEADQALRQGLELLPRPIIHMTHQDDILVAIFSPDGKYVATGSADQTARVWAVNNGHEVARMKHGPFEFRHSTSVETVTFSPDGQYLATASDDFTARVWEVVSGHEVSRMIHKSYVHDVTFCPSGQYLASGSHDGMVKVWEAASGREMASINPTMTVNPGYSVYYPVHSVAFSHDGIYLAMASHNNSIVRVWDWRSGRECMRINHDENGVIAIAFSAYGAYLVTTSFNIAWVWKSVASQEVARMIHGDMVNVVTFSPNGRYLATASGSLHDARDNAAHMWEVNTGFELARMNHERSVKDIVFNHNGNYLATASEDTTARIWEANNGHEVARLKHEGSVNTIAFSPDGRYLASSNGATWLLDIRNEQESIHLTHASYPWAIAFSPDGKYLATTSNDGVCCVWEILTGQEVSRIIQGGSPVDVAFSPNGKYLATASSDHTARLWLWRPEDLIAEACNRLTRGLTQDEWHHYLGDEEYRPTCS